MKRQLLIEVDCGDVVCTNKCDWYDSKGEACSMFEARLVDGMVRHFQCLGAEERAKELTRGTKP